jgi:predicted transcriptional regulator
MTDVTVRLSDDARAKLEKIAEDKGISIDQLIADAVGLEMTVAEIKSNGGRVLAERHGSFQEVPV